MRNCLLIILLLLVSCRNLDKKFNSEEWQAIDGNNFSELREPIVNDLIKNQLKKGLKYDQVIKLLGNPDIDSETKLISIGYYLTYEIPIWSLGPEPSGGKQLLIAFSADSTVTDYKITKWKYK